MRRSLLRSLCTVLLPVLALGLILTGCDSAGPNGGNGGSDAFEYPSSNYGAETVTNLLAFDLGVRVGNASDNSETVFDELYTGAVDDKTVPTSGISTQQSTYGDIASGVDLSSLTDDAPLLRSQNLESPDSPNPGSQVTTDELLTFYFQQAGANDVTTTENGVVLSQFAEKMLLGTPIYGQGAAILSDFADGNVSSNQAEQWDAAFGYFGFPRTLEPFLDYSGGGEGLASGPAQDIDGDGAVDLTSEYVHTWAAYAIERSAAAENNGNANDFARRAFDALVKGREDIENGNDPADHAQTALDAWEKVVAVNVIHYINSLEGALSNLDDGKTVEQGDIDEGAWGEAKAFAWNLQFYNSALSDSQLNDILEDIGNDPPYGEMTVSDYEDDLAAATQILQDAYGFNASNVENW
ncbi:MAG: hypothetical protein ABEL04_03415 [Salinibacter sp.]|uniref:hypothetical protein n=1 Tax=Salinibacter sp. TaxID=2065818 RepID=UPI0035D413BC